MTTTLFSRRASANAEGDVSVITAATVVGGEHPLTAEELAHACGAHLEWIAQLADAGIVQADTRSARTQWRFRGADLERALEARRLERDFGAGIDAAALIIDMRDEIRRLNAVLHAQGLRALG